VNVTSVDERKMSGMSYAIAWLRRFAPSQRELSRCSACRVVVRERSTVMPSWTVSRYVPVATLISAVWRTRSMTEAFPVDAPSLLVRVALRSGAAGLEPLLICVTGGG
jgi:hypothetical protein